jgi:hypothetical protein
LHIGVVETNWVSFTFHIKNLKVNSQYTHDK